MSSLVKSVGNVLLHGMGGSTVGGATGTVVGTLAVAVILAIGLKYYGDRPDYIAPLGFAGLPLIMASTVFGAAVGGAYGIYRGIFG